MISIIYALLTDNNKLVASLNSIATQTHQDYEIIIVGNSVLSLVKDKIKKLVYKGANITYYQIDDDKSYFYAYLYGIKRAKGQFLAFIDATDYVYQSYLEVLIKKMEDKDVAIATSSFARHYNNKTFPGITYSEQILHGVAKFDLKEITFFRLWNSIIRKDLLDDFLASEDLSSYNQITLVAGLLVKAKKYYRHQEVLYFRGKDKQKRRAEVEKSIDAIIKCQGFNLPSAFIENLVIDELLVNQSRIVLADDSNQQELDRILATTSSVITKLKRKIIFMKRPITYKRAALALVNKKYKKASKLLEKFF